MPQPLLRSYRDLLQHAGRRLATAEPSLYALLAASTTLWVACLFYSSLRLQTLYAHLWSFPQHFDQLVASGERGSWSAPLDDVFIHFDFARATARGFPLEWSPGNGYSSGGTSLSYPFALALGYVLGFRDLDLMFWAAWLASVCVFVLLLAGRQLFAGLPRLASYSLPPILLSVGALDWTLFSGMEVAFFLAIWSGTFLTWDKWLRAINAKEAWQLGNSAGLGLWCALLVATRPEAVICVGIFGVSLAWALWRHSTRGRALMALAIALAPAALVVVGHAAVNYWLTGSHAAAGALTKLEIHDPYLATREIFDAWKFHLSYQLLRVTQYHFGEGYLGWVLWPLALAPLCFRATRRNALLLWLSLVLWAFVVALNGQVRWQNERYAMPAVAWFLMNVALGVGILGAQAARLFEAERVRALALGALVTSALVCFAVGQASRFTDQLWFFGRASRNILDQQFKAGQVIRNVIKPLPKRILVGDAGAITYASDLPSLDLIGLGGYKDFPFAEANRTGLGAAVELLERMGPTERPDLLALYPGWWGSFIDWFGRRVGEVPVRGNVICGGRSKVLYRPDWSAFAGSAVPQALSSSERITDELDLADLVNEKQHAYRLSEPRIGHVTMKLLDANPGSRRPIWDAGRIVPAGKQHSFRLHGLTARKELRLIFRVAPEKSGELGVALNGGSVRKLALSASDRWLEPELTIPADETTETLDVDIAALAEEHVLYHVWAVQGP